MVRRRSACRRAGRRSRFVRARLCALRQHGVHADELRLDEICARLADGGLVSGQARGGRPNNGFSGLGAYFGPVVEIFDDHLAVYYNQYSAGDYEGFATQVEIAWVVWMTSTALTAFGSRAGTNWMQWTAAGPSSPSPASTSRRPARRLLIPPNASGRILGQPFLSGVYPAGSGATTIPHNLGYIPIWWADQQVAPTYAPDIVTLDTANLYITPRGSTTLGPVSYSILAQQWV